MTDTESMELKELRIKRGSIKGRLTTFKNYIAKFDEQSRLSGTQLKELKTRLKRIEEMFDDYNLIQTCIEVKECKLDSVSDLNNEERRETEDTLFMVISQAQEIIEQNEKSNCDDSSSSKSGHDVIPTNVKLPTIKLPNFDGDSNKWLEFRDIYTSLIHNNEALTNIIKYQYLKGSLSGTAASVIESLELSNSNYDVAWKLICERFNNERQLVYTHLKNLFNIPTMNKECEQSLRFLIDHISKNLRALNSLDEKTDNWDTLIIFMFAAKLDSVTCAKWEEHKNNFPKQPKLEEFYDFLRKRADVIEMVAAGSSDKGSRQQQYNYKRIDKQQSAFVAATYENKNNFERVCSICNGEHLIYYCEQFNKVSPEDRFKLIVEKKCCVNCLRSGHFAQQCRSGPCKICGKKHNSLLHFDKPVEPPVKRVSLSTCISNQVLLSTAIVNVTCSSSEQVFEARCLLDCGSQSSFVSQDLKDKMTLKCEPVESVCVTGVNKMSFEALQRCSVKIQSRTTSCNIPVNAFVIEQITSTLPSYEVDVSNFNLPNNVTLADPGYYRPAKIDLLLGADVFWNIISNEQIKLGHNKPVLQNSMFGWLVAGPVMCCKNNHSENKIVCNFSHEINTQLNKFWELEEVPSNPVMSQEEEACEQHFVQHTRRLADGRFCVKLPLKIEPENLGDSYSISRKRFDSLERRFQRQPNIKKQYVEFIEEYEALGHASFIERPDKAKTVFLPHHPVLKQQSESTKCRVVFDASAKTSTGVSLNEIMMVGPTVQDDIFSILTRFRQHEFIFTGDLEKMFRQIFIDSSQRHLQTILWRAEEKEPIKYMQLNTVTYGTSAAPFLSTRCLVQLALECEDALIKQVILHDFYIDDIISGYSDEKTLKEIYKGVSEQLKTAGFNLRKIKSNSQGLLRDISSETDKSTNQEILQFSAATNTLGIEWDPNSDSVLMSVSKPKMFEKCETFTKRMVLSVTSSIFDPLGLLSVCIITCKMILQLLWQQKTGWDEDIPQFINEMWLKFIHNLKHLENLKIPRHAVCSNPVTIELHTFSDASLKAYAACVYIRSIDELGNVTVRLLCAKSKVAPIKTTTIPRLELCGAVLASRLCNKVSNALRFRIDVKHFWCDSKVVLGWLNTPPNKLSTFVSHRVVEIVDLSANREWKYVPSLLNPADLASRGVYPDEVQSLSLWWEGPSFLKFPVEQWPTQQSGDMQANLPEIRAHAIHVDVPKTNLIEFERYSSFAKLRRIFAYVCRFISNCKINNENNRSTGALSVAELERAELMLTFIAQQECFSRCKLDFKSVPSIHKLTPITDENGLIRVGGRIDNSEYSYDKKHPMLIDGKHHYSKLIFEYYHTKLLHAGPQLLLSIVREHYWAVNGRILAKKVCNKCVMCRRMKAETAKQIMGRLPPQRLTPGFPFEVTGTDYAGPFHILNRKGRGAKLIKCYLCVFICFKVKAVHLELVSDLTTEAFILALRRFMSRRGKPREIFCDNGTNFVGASREIARIVKDSNSVSDIANEGINFRFSPVYSPHFGGLYEAAVKSAKFHMKRALGNTHLTFEELATLFSQIEAILNSRPLSPMSTDPNDLGPLTPGHFLVGRPLTSLPAPDLQDANPNRLHRYARIEQARQHFWARWSREYICELQQRSKWQDRRPDIKPNDMVLIRDETSPPLKWPLGRVTVVHPGSDGACRVAEIRTSKGVVKRAINKICPLLDEE